MRSRIFDGLTDDERERWLSRATSATLERGHTLARQGEPARHFYLLETGFLKVVQQTAEGAEVIISSSRQAIRLVAWWRLEMPSTPSPPWLFSPR